MNGNQTSTRASLAASMWQRRQFLGRWHKVLIALASIVVFATTYALILPAITLDRDPAAATVNATKATPLDVTPYVTAATIKYSTDDGDTWLNTQPEEGQQAPEIPANARFKLSIDYERVPKTALQQAGYQMTYALPDAFRKAQADGAISSNGNTIGHITASGDTVTMTFTQDWVDNKANALIEGDFFVEAEVDLSYINEHTDPTITIGNINLALDFDGNLVTNYGTAEVKKTASTIEETAEGSFVTYTLTVTAGEIGANAVTVQDEFTTNVAYVKETGAGTAGYIGVTTTEASTQAAPENPTPENLANAAATSPVETLPAGNAQGTVQLVAPTLATTDPQALKWTIGDMAAHEVRTLTYKVKLNPGYMGAGTSTKNLGNSVTATTANTSDTATANVPLTGTATMSKMMAAYEADADGSGGGTVTYYIWVNAPTKNTYTLTNVLLKDALDGTIDNKTATPPKYRQYMEYQAGSFTLYQGGGNGQNSTNGLTNPTSVAPTFPTEPKHNSHFEVNVGSLAPGESKTLVYSVHLEPGLFVQAANGEPPINNRSAIYSDKSKQINANGKLNAYEQKNELDRKAWNRKIVGQSITDAQTIAMTGNAYDATGTAVQQIANPGSFIAPDGSYQYQVLANEAGDWDISSATMHDQLSDTHMEYVGYVRVDAFDIAAGQAPASSLADSDAMAVFAGKTPNQTIWVKVDGKQNFSFSPDDLGLNANQAYRLTYYAKPVNLGDVSQVVVGNTFGLSGTVGIGNYSYTLTGITAGTSVTLQGGNSFQAEKQSWYYEAPTVSTGDFAKGALYWAIKVDGDRILAGTQLQDITSADAQSNHLIRSGSLVGVYKAPDTLDLSTYDSMSDLVASGQLQAVPNASYSVTQAAGNGADANHRMVLKLEQDVTLAAGQALYAIVKTEPGVLPQADRDAYTYENSLATSANGTDWLPENTTSQILYGRQNVFKETGAVFTKKGTQYTYTQSKNDSIKTMINRAGITDDGVYIAWQVHVNYEGNLEGRYRVIDTLPDGLDLQSVHLGWAGSGIQSAAYTPKPTMPQISGLGAEWTHRQEWRQSNGLGNFQNNYYVNGNQVIWEVDNLKTTDTTDANALEFQVIARVTDPDVLLGGQEKLFTNTVAIETMEGRQIGLDTDGIAVKKESLSKRGNYDPNVNGGVYPFELHINDLGQDLVAGTDKVTVVDTMSSSLLLDATSIQVLNTTTGAAVPAGTDPGEWSSAVQGQELRITVPDNLPLTIKYNAFVQAAPGQSLNISNDAHWEGYTAGTNTQVEDANFSYTVGGTVGSDPAPKIHVVKMDQYDNSIKLPNATFTLTQGTMATDGTFTAAAGATPRTATTNADGKLTFGDGTDLLSYNTVYKLEETAAPTGYVLDGTPQYIVVADPDPDQRPAQGAFPANVMVWYSTTEYTVSAYNHKGEIEVTKSFADAAGNPINTLLNGTYTFALYADADDAPTGEPLQTKTLTVKNGTSDPAGGKVRFTGLTLGAKYHVRELDDDGEPIASGATGVINDQEFAVTANPAGALTPAVSADQPDGWKQSVAVTNQVRYPELPNTGGIDGETLQLAGLALVGAAGLAYVLSGRTRRRDGRHALNA